VPLDGTAPGRIRTADGRRQPRECYYDRWKWAEVELQDWPEHAGDQARRVLIVSHYASERTGGAGSIPLRLFGRLRARGVEAWLLTHVSSRGELSELLPAAEFGRVIFAPSLPGFGPIFTWGERFPTGLRTIAWGVTQLERQVAMVPVVRRLVRELAIDVVHQPISVSPVTPSPLRRLGAPVVMGPLNGGMELPPAFADRDSSLYALTKAARPAVAAAMNKIMPGRPEADAVLVANDRTRSLLPRSARKRATEVSDIGVVLDSWPILDERSAGTDAPANDTATRFLFVGRLVGWKGVDILLDAFALVRDRIPALLEIVGEGPERSRLAEQADRIGCEGDVSFRGWLEPADCARRMRACDVFVSPSLQESGGIAVLEAMACARPVIAAAWGGHLNSVDETVGVLVDVSSRAAMVGELADAMVRLARDPGLRSRLGAAGRRRLEGHYDWDVLVDRTLRVYDEASASRAARRQGRLTAAKLT
jgi:glycosyltransferase involved in cell wall biosynthesis